jgi:glycosyltransferase involved in cell wall biosynthesis/GT2 family glycosyltransferase
VEISGEYLVSVIIPSFNRTSLLYRAISSAINQTYTNLEIIIIDDGSTEDIKKVVDSFHDDRIVFLRHDRNKGVSAARNTGIKHSKGEYVAFLDSDDEWYERKIELQLSDLKCKGNEYLVSYCKRETYDDEMEKVVKYSPPGRDGNRLDDLLFECVITAPSVVAKRACFDEVGVFDEQMRFAEDWEMWIRLAKHFSFAYVDDVLVRCHNHRSGRLCDNGGNDFSHLDRIYNVHADVFRKHRKARAQFLMRQGYTLFRNGNPYIARKFYLKSMIINPLRFEPIVAMIKSFGKSSNKEESQMKATKQWKVKSHFCIIKYELQKEDVLLGKLSNLLYPFSKSLTLISLNYIGPINVGEGFVTPSPNKKRNFMSRNKYLELLQLRNGFELLRLKPKPDFVVFFTYTATMAFPMLIARIRNAKAIKILTGDTRTLIRDDSGHYQIVWSFYTNLMKRIMLMLTDRIIVESPSILGSYSYLDTYGIKNTPKSVIALDVNTNEFRCVNTFSERQKTVGYIGRLSSEKGIMNLMDAIPKVLSQDEDVKFVIIGDGPLREQIERFVLENNLGESVSIIGRASHNQIPSFLNKFKLLVVPSFSEALPSAPREAMACGTPVLASQVGGMVDLIDNGNSSFLLRNNSPEVIADSIIKSLNHPKLEQISKRARETILERYDYSSSSDKWRKLIEQMAA